MITPPGNRLSSAIARPVWLMLIIMLFAGSYLIAQTPAPTPAPGSGGGTSAAPVGPVAAPRGTTSTDAEINLRTGELPSVRRMFEFSPVINSIIAILSVVAVALFVMFMLMINTSRMIPATFVDDVTKLVVARKYPEAADYCRNNRPIFAASIIQRCAENTDKDHATLMAIIEAEGRRRADVIWNRISYLVDLSNIAPMLGLLGTVLGMLEAFFILPNQSASMNSKALAAAIGGAMTATFFGLIVAIVSVIFYTIVKSRMIKTMSEVEQVVHSIADHIKRGSGR